MQISSGRAVHHFYGNETHLDTSKDFAIAHEGILFGADFGQISLGEKSNKKMSVSIRTYITAASQKTDNDGSKIKAIPDILLNFPLN